MEKRRSLQKQHGFFDFGIAAILSLIFGGTAAAIDSQHAEKSSLAKQDTEIVQTVDQQVAIVESTSDE